MNKVSILLSLLFILGSSHAVNINPNGYGEAIILPYYTVNNNLNTLVTINNSTDQVKALKLNIREGKKGLSVLSFNLYLAPNDMWTAGLVSVTSSLQGHQDEESAAIIFADASCTPLLDSGQQFLASEIDPEDFDTDMLRARDGYIEIFEMGALDPTFGLGLDASFVAGQTNNCAAIQVAHESGIWDESSGGDLTEQLLPAVGGLSATASLIDVAEGVMFSIDSVAFENFYPTGSIYHSSPNDSQVPSLAQADNTSVLVSEGILIQTEWEQGYQAISALLTKNQVTSYYAVEPNVAGKTEVVFTFPTKRFHYQENDNPIPPFTERYDRVDGACEEFNLLVWDRDSEDNYCQTHPNVQICQGHNADPPPIQTPYFTMCFVTSVLELLENDNFFGRSAILGASNLTVIPSFESGKVKVTFDQSVDSPAGQASQNMHRYQGLPVIAFNLTKYTNGNAAPGFLAQYGDSDSVYYTTKVD